MFVLVHKPGYKYRQGGRTVYRPAQRLLYVVVRRKRDKAPILKRVRACIWWGDWPVYEWLWCEEHKIVYVRDREYRRERPRHGSHVTTNWLDQLSRYGFDEAKEMLAERIVMEGVA